jgi:hypothetical protein
MVNAEGGGPAFDFRRNGFNANPAKRDETDFLRDVRAGTAFGMFSIGAGGGEKARDEEERALRPGGAEDESYM